MMGLNRVCLTFDINYIAYAKVLMNSISSNLSDSQCCEIVVLTGCDALINLDIVELGEYENVNVKVIDIKGELANFSPSGRFPAQVYARLFMGNYIKGIVLYLDVDMVVNCCVSELFREFDSDFGFGACIDTGVLFQKALGRNRNLYAFNYFNAGMFICDLNNKKVLNYFRDAIYLAGNNNYPLADQDALNFSIKGRFSVISTKFNYTGIFFPPYRSIIHYAHIKPTLQLKFLSAFRDYEYYVNQEERFFPYRQYTLLELLKKLVFVIFSNVCYKAFKFFKHNCNL